MECSPDLSFLTVATGNDLYKANNAAELYQFGGGGGGGGNDMFAKIMRPGVMVKQRKTNFTPREVEELLSAVEKRRDIILFGTAGGQIWARAWQEVAQEVTAVEGIQRSEGDVRKKWTYLKWEAKNTSKPGRDPTSRTVLEILTGGDPEAAATIGNRSILEEMLVPQPQPNLAGSGGPSSPVSIPNPPKKNIASRPTPTQSPQPQPALLPQMQAEEEQPLEVCLRWNSYHKNMQTFFPSLLNNEQFVDVTLACEGQSIKCHKVMLSACSTYFEELLSQNPCQHPIVLMKDLCFWEIQALVDFMYRGEVNVSQDKLPQLLKAAAALQIKGLTGPTNSTSSNAHDEDSRASSNNSDGSIGNNRRQRKRKSNRYSRNQVNHQRPTTPVSSFTGNIPYRSSPSMMPSMVRTPISSAGATSPLLSSQPPITNSSYVAADSGSTVLNCTNAVSSSNSSSDLTSAQQIKSRKTSNPSQQAVALTTGKMISEQRSSQKIFIKEEIIVKQEPEEIKSRIMDTRMSQGESEEETDSLPLETDSNGKGKHNYNAKDMRYSYDEEEDDGSDSMGSGTPLSPPTKVILLDRTVQAHSNQHNNDGDHDDEEEEVEEDDDEEDEGDGNF